MKATLLGLAGLIMAVYAFSLWQDHLRATSPLLPVTFGHIDHRIVNCVDCHHNFVDQSGQGLCFDCHKTDPTVNALVEEQFHELCMGCHLDKQRAGDDGGPIRACSECHTADEAP